MVTINEASQSALLARQQLQAKQQEVQSAQERLRQAEQALPNATSQRNLRQKIGAGLKGMLLRKKVTQAKDAIQGQQQIVKGYERNLKKFETEQLQPVEAQIQEAQAREKAYDVVLSAGAGKLEELAKYGGSYEREYARKALLQRDIATQSFNQQIQDIQSQLPEGDKLIIDYKNMRITGIESGQMGGGSYSLPDYNKAAADFNTQIKTMPEIQAVNLDMSKMSLQDRDVSSMYKLKSFQELLNRDLIPTVLAQEIGPKWEVTPYERPRLIESIKSVFIGKKLEGEGNIGAALKTIGGVSAAYGGQAIRDIKTIPSKVTEIIAPSQNIEPIYFGNKEFTGRLIEKPTYVDASGLPIGGTLSSVPEVKDISVDYSRSPIRRTEEILFPAASIPLASSNERVYLPDKASEKKFKQLVRPDSPYFGKGGKEFTDFLREQQAQYKRDLGRYNELLLRYNINPQDKLVENELSILQERLKMGNRGTVQNVIYQTTKDEGKELYYGLTGLQGVYSGAKTALAFELGTGGLNLGLKAAGATEGLSSLVPSFMKVTGTPNQLNWLKGASNVAGLELGIGFSALEGAKEFQRTGDIGAVISRGIGFGFGLGGGKITSDIDNWFSSGQASKDIKKFKEGVSKLNDRLSSTSLNIGPRGKKGSTVLSSYADKIVYVNYNGQIVKMTKSQAIEMGLKPISKNEELNILENYLRFGSSNKFSSKAEKVRDLLNRATNNNQRKEILNLVENTYGKKFLKDFIEQESTLIPSISIETVKPSEKIISRTPKSGFKGFSFIETGSSQFYAEPSSFSGQALYERTEFQDPLQSFGGRQENKQVQGSINILGIKSLSKQQSRQENKQNLFLGSLNNQLPEQKTNQQPRQEFTPKLESRTSQTPKTQDPLKIQPRRPTPRQPERTKQKEPRPEPIKPIIPKFDEDRKKRKIPKDFFGKGEEFLAITKRRGKEVVLAKTKTAEKAAQIARRSVLGTLGATAKVRTTSGRQVKLAPDRIFRESKTDPLAIVQRKTARLSSLGERREIKQSKQRPFRIL